MGGYVLGLWICLGYVGRLSWGQSALPLCGNGPAMPSPGGQCNGSAWSGVTVRSVNWTGVNLEGSQMFSVEILNSSLRKASLKGSQWTGGVINATDLSEASFSDGEFQSMVFGGVMCDDGEFDVMTIFRWSVTDDTRCLNAKVRSSNATMIQVDNSFLPMLKVEGTYLKFFTMKGSNMAQANWFQTQVDSQLDVSSSNLTGSFFVSCDFANATFSESDLSKTSFANSTILAAAFQSGVLLANSSFESSVLPGASFNSTRTDFRFLDFRNANLTQASFPGVDISYGNFARSTLDQALFDGAVATWTNFSYSSLVGASFAGANLFGSEFTGADLSNADFREANTTSAVFTDAKGMGSINGSTDSGSSTNRACFPGDAVVHLEDGSTKMMKELNVGDHILTDSGVFSPVFYFSHRLQEGLFHFIEIHTSDNRRIHLSPSHKLFVNGRLQEAKVARVGDSLGRLKPGVISSVAHRTLQGLFNPHTLEGSLVVDQIEASCYTSAVPTNLAHSLLAFERLIFQLGFPRPLTALWIEGLSPS
uniref:Hint domain-containing protein n=1 Tax=Compsopogon caeruleus TaxID=31354 RepID=A0A7S1T7F0_9RHOD